MGAALAGQARGQEVNEAAGQGRAGPGAAFGSSFAEGGRLSTSGTGGLGRGATLSRAGSAGGVVAAAASHHRRRHHHPQQTACHYGPASPRLASLPLARSACAVGSPRPPPRPLPPRCALQHAAPCCRSLLRRCSPQVCRRAFGARAASNHLSSICQPACHPPCPLLAFGFLPSLSTEAVQFGAPCYTSIAHSLLSAPCHTPFCSGSHPPRPSSRALSQLLLPLHPSAMSLFSTDVVLEWRPPHSSVVSSSSSSSSTSCNFRFNLRNERAGPLKVQIVENEFAALFVSELHNKGHRTAGGSFRSTVSCKGTNGAHFSRGNSNNTALVGLDSEDLTVDSAKKIQERSSLAQHGIPPVEQHLGTAFEQAIDEPGEGFATIEEAIEAIKEGKFVLVVDDENRENEGDLIMAGSLVTPQAMAFLVRHSTGIVCVSMKGDDLDRLGLPLMVPQQNNSECMKTAFTWTVDAKHGTTTGVSAADRCQTIRTLASPSAGPGDIVAPGHVFPLRYREGGVLKRRGHTEAALDLTELAGLPPAGVLCEVVNDEDGSMARLPYLKKFAKQHGFPLISIDALVKFKEAINESVLVKRTASARLPTEYGEFQVFSYVSNDGLEHAAIVEGDISSGLEVYVRIHSECLTGDVFRSTRCDCGSQLSDSLSFIKRMGRGVVVYMRGHEGRGIGLGHKMRAYNLQDAGSDTVEANLQLGLPVDSREYGISAQMLQDLGIKTITLLSNNPAKVKALKELGIRVNERRSIFSPVTKENRRYLETKRIKMGHMYTSRLPAVGSESGVDIEGNLSRNDPDRLI